MTTIGDSDVTITGKIVASDWDDEDNVIAVVISVTVFPDDPDEDEYSEDYLVANNEMGRELLTLVGRSIEAIGKVETDEDGSKTIYIESYSLTMEETSDEPEAEPENELEEEPSKGSQI